ncbi:hypothetical protein THAOC_31893 [Thalassiosira oceanica]|uniref:BspA family leucine-rich repeat surface protein n=1 Tax=Thalassiosira oceanica TaxID=159749 RepID=K0R778_THAOC|nr:hypothetical protein THAOC_31893 [Thalassiosira oceanica]|eukprot:EJK49253.1 hypothetical protein THAOC_31893 [Thalassiosira oceanica]
MEAMFGGATAFNQPISIDTAKMSYMFYDATAFNQDLCHFGDNFSQKTVTLMFYDSACSNKNEPSSASGPWCAVTTCPPQRHMFTKKAELATAMGDYVSQGCPNGPNCQATSVHGGAIGNWDVSRLTDFSFLFDSFSGADAFNEPINWNTESATSMKKMFEGATAFNQPLSFDTAKVTSMQYMFQGATAFNQPLSFDTANVTNVREYMCEVHLQ